MLSLFIVILVLFAISFAYFKFFINKTIKVESEIEGYSFIVNDKNNLQKYLENFGFWEGVVLDKAAAFENQTSENIIAPRSLKIHISDRKYFDNATFWSNNEYAAGTEIYIDKWKNFHLWIGLNPGFFNNKYNNLEHWLDQKIVQALFKRSIKTYKDSEITLKQMQKNKSREPFFLSVNKL